MANGHGGYRRPASPAPASGPGALSRRTDGQVQAAPTGMDYGDHKQLMQQESTAPMAATPAVPDLQLPSGQPAGPVPSGSPVTPIGAPTQRPNEPITAGVDHGPGPGSEVLPLEHTAQFQAQGPMTQMLSQLAARDTSGSLSAVLQFAKLTGA